MTAQADRRISFRRAAEMIYRTSKPTPQQIQRVAELTAQGELSGDSRGTTADAVAAFITKISLQKQGSGGVARPGPRGQRQSDQMQHVYQETLKQYFLAVLLRRKVHNATRAFRRAVLAGQIALLAAVGLFVLLSIRTMFPPMSPERTAAVNWIEENTERHRIIKFHPTEFDNDGKAKLWVEYHYTTPQGRSVDTRREFTVAGGKVVSVNSSD